MDPKCDLNRKFSKIVYNFSREPEKIISYFPQNKQNFKVKSLYRGSRDGWFNRYFSDKVFF